MAMYYTPAGSLLFIHVPKTGGTTIEWHLEQAFEVRFKATRRAQPPSTPRGLKHYHGSILTELFQSDPPAHTFMIVRDPVDRLVSEFKWQSRKPHRFYRGLSFQLWLRWNLARAANNPYQRDNHFRPQVEFEAFQPKIFRLEDGMSECFRWLRDLTGLSPPSSPVRRNQSRPLSITVTPDDRALIATFYQADFDRYGYQP